MFYDFRKLGVDVRVVGVVLLNTLQDLRYSKEYRGRTDNQDEFELQC